MAEIQQQDSNHKQDSIRRKKLSTRVDLTPMVDLGFLLITFFIFTTALTKPTAMRLIIPADKNNADPPSLAANSKTLNLILSSNNNVIYYNGLDKNAALITNYSSTGLREIIQNKMNEVGKRTGNKNETVILIKPTNYSTFKNVVDVLDEMQINAVTRFVLMEADKEELALLNKQ